MRMQLSQPLPHHTIYIDPAIAKIAHQYHRVSIVTAALAAVLAMIISLVVLTHIVGIQESASCCGYTPG